MRFLGRVAALICAINLVVGKTFAWLSLGIVVGRGRFRAVA